jgi:hypothetical protein
MLAKIETVLRYAIWMSVCSFGAMAMFGKQADMPQAVSVVHGIIGASAGYLLARFGQVRI